MARAQDGFKALREVEVSMEYLADNVSIIRGYLGDNPTIAAHHLQTALEYSDALTKALRQLLDIAEGRL